MRAKTAHWAVYRVSTEVHTARLWERVLGDEAESQAAAWLRRGQPCPKGLRKALSPRSSSLLLLLHNAPGWACMPGNSAWFLCLLCVQEPITEDGHVISHTQP